MLHITALYGSILALILLWLAYNIVKFRRTEQVELGDGGSEKGVRHIRAQANAIENIPITLLLFAIYEINGGSMYVLHAIGILLVFARIIHPLGLVSKKGVSFGRYYGTLITWLAIIALALLNIYHFASNLL